MGSYTLYACSRASRKHEQMIPVPPELLASLAKALASTTESGSTAHTREPPNTAIEGADLAPFSLSTTSRLG